MKKMLKLTLSVLLLIGVSACRKKVDGIVPTEEAETIDPSLQNKELKNLLQNAEDTVIAGNADYDAEALVNACNMMSWYMGEMPDREVVTGTVELFMENADPTFGTVLNALYQKAYMTTLDGGDELIENSAWDGEKNWQSDDVTTFFGCVFQGAGIDISTVEISESYDTLNFKTILGEIHDNVHVGVMGGSLASAQYTAEIMNWYLSTLPSTDSITAETSEYLQTIDDADGFYYSIDAVYGFALSTLEESGAATLRDAGYTGEIIWTKEQIDTLFTAIEAAF